jgi:hypothetical protein
MAPRHPRGPHGDLGGRRCRAAVSRMPRQIRRKPRDSFQASGATYPAGGRKTHQ